MSREIQRITDKRWCGKAEGESTIAVTNSKLELPRVSRVPDGDGLGRVHHREVVRSPSEPRALSLSLSLSLRASFAWINDLRSLIVRNSMQRESNTRSRGLREHHPRFSFYSRASYGPPTHSRVTRLLTHKHNWHACFHSEDCDLNCTSRRTRNLVTRTLSRPKDALSTAPLLERRSATVSVSCSIEPKIKLALRGRCPTNM